MTTTTGGQATGGVGPCPGLPYDSSTSPGGACTGTSAQPGITKVDLYILLDRSQSMGARWLDATAAIEQFVADPNVVASDVRVGFQFFGLTGGIDDAQDCKASSYATPAVWIGSLPTVGPLIAAAIAAVTPSGEAPSVPALQGAIQCAGRWQDLHPERLTILAWVTDGSPTACADQSDASLVAAAEAGMALDPPIRTYVFGLGVGADAYRLNALAQSGGTGQATLIEDGNLPSGLAAALAQTVTNPSLTSNQSPCEYLLPLPPDPLSAFSYDQTLVVHTPGSGGEEQVPYATSLAGCSPVYGGWYYDVVPDSDPNAPDPSKLVMCPCTCASLNGGKLDILLGCHTEIHTVP
jgi:hypothetical protein